MYYLYFFNVLLVPLSLSYLSSKFCISPFRIFHIVGHLNQVWEVLFVSVQVLQ
jgi:hypothetical protein